ncbi:hypothetical protein GCM10011490_07540 [Pseudoclavibacter endophyticus]|nr:hypothetical protein GCM10011490_07540 [Pseudoclavibacter endophyticus]
MFGLTFEKLLLIGVIAAFIIGPERLPQAAEQLRRFVRWAKSTATGAKERVREEMGDEFDEVDWRKLDPRQYDPRRIIREALLEDGEHEATNVGPRPGVGPGSGVASRSGVASGAEVAGPATRAAFDAPATSAGAPGASGAPGARVATADAPTAVREAAGGAVTLGAGGGVAAGAAPFDPEAT